jgi:uncharacterized GH25 family protein
MHVGNIEMCLRQKGVWTNAVAAVRVVDTDGYPVVGATVTGEWTGSAVDIIPFALESLSSVSRSP